MISQHRHTGSYVSKLSNKLRRKLDMLCLLYTSDAADE